MSSGNQVLQTEMVLIVDNDEQYVERLIDMLEDAVLDCHYNIAGGFFEALDIVHREFPVIMILALQLPGRGGIEVLKELKSLGSTCRVVVISNDMENNYKAECMELGAVYFLDKTLEFEKLPHVLKSLLTEKGANKNTV